MNEPMRVLGEALIASIYACDCMFISSYFMRACCMNLCAVLDLKRLELYTYPYGDDDDDDDDVDDYY